MTIQAIEVTDHDRHLAGRKSRRPQGQQLGHDDQAKLLSKHRLDRGARRQRVHRRDPVREQPGQPRREQLLRDHSATGATGDCGSLHSIYVAHFSSGNRIISNTFEDACGSRCEVARPVQINRIEGNRFRAIQKAAAVEEWFCDAGARATSPNCSASALLETSSATTTFRTPGTGAFLSPAIGFSVDGARRRFQSRNAFKSEVACRRLGLKGTRLETRMREQPITTGGDQLYRPRSRPAHAIFTTSPLPICRTRSRHGEDPDGAALRCRDCDRACQHRGQPAAPAPPRAGSREIETLLVAGATERPVKTSGIGADVASCNRFGRSTATAFRTALQRPGRRRGPGASPVGAAALRLDRCCDRGTR